MPSRLLRSTLVASLAIAQLCAISAVRAQDKGPDKAQDKVIATVNGRHIVASDLKLADAEIGTDLGSLPEPTRSRVLVEYLIETQLMADAAEQASLGQGTTFEQRLQYWRRKALRDSYFDSKVKALVTEAEARRSFDAQVGAAGRGQLEIKASHILLDSETTAREVFELVGHGSDFAEMAQRHSIDPGSKTNAGSLGYFLRGQMVPQFEEAAFKLDKGEVSLPVKTQFGWHIIKLEDKRERRPPSFESVKSQITAQLIHQKAQDVVDQMRAKARIEYLDPTIKAQVEADRQQGPAKR